MSRLTVAERILLHLSSYSEDREAFVCHPDVSQRGIADAVGVSRAHAALELKRLRDAEEVEERVAHVKGAQTRRKVYFLTPEGERKARIMREHALTRRVVVEDAEGPKEMPGEEAMRRLTRSHRWSRTRALQAILTKDVILAEEPVEAPAVEKPSEFFGRERELQTLRDWASRDAPPMLVMTGVLGVGKTTLLQAFASECQGPVHYCTVAEWDTAASLARTLGASLAGAGRSRLREYAAGPVHTGEVASILSADASGHLLILDDCTASREGELLAKALVGVRGPKVIAAAPARPTFYGRKELVLEALVEEMELDGLDREAAMAYGESLGITTPPEEAYRITGGHPLSLRLMAAAGGEEGIDELSTFVKDQLMGGLGPEERDSLKRASVHRKPFPASAVGPEAAGILDGLAQKGIVRHSGGLYVVPSAVASLIRETLSGAERKQFHSAAADACLDTGDELERLHHLVRAGRTLEVAMRIRRVGRGLVESGGAAELWRIMEGVEPPERYRAHWMLEAGRALDDLGRWEEAEEALSEAAAGGDRETRWAATLIIGRIHSKRGDLRKAREAFESLRDASDPVLRADGLRGLGVVLRKMAEYAAAREALQEASDVYREQGAGKEAGLALMELGIVALGSGEGGEAREALGDALRVLEGDPVEEPRVRVNLAVAARMQGDLEGALEHLEIAAEMAGDLGQMRTGAYALSNAADVHLALGDVGKAEEACLLAERWARALQDPVMLSLLKANQGEAAAHRGDGEATKAYFEESLALLEDVEAPKSLAARLGAYADAMESLGDAATADELRRRMEGL
jgi:tetratricopeptide (TPR) repeat protein/DNA-binding MarR family transcriptional regulator